MPKMKQRDGKQLMSIGIRAEWSHLFNVASSWAFLDWNDIKRSHSVSSPFMNSQVKRSYATRGKYSKDGPAKLV